MARVQDEGFVSPVAGGLYKWAKLKLSTARGAWWDETRSAMNWVVPCFTDIWYALMIDKDGEHAWWTDQIPTAATDDKFVYFNPEWYFKLTLDERLFVNSHEIEHAMYGHAGINWIYAKQGEVRYSDGVSIPYISELMNMAEDYVINDQLVKAKIGKMPEGGLHWPEKITGDMSCVDAYRLLWKEARKKKKSPGEGEGLSQPQREHVSRTTDKNGQDAGPGGGKPFDVVLKPGEGQGKDTNEAMSERNENEWSTAIQAAMESAKARGQLPLGIEQAFTRRLQPKADWRDVAFVTVSRHIGNDRYTWDRLDPQFAYRRVGVPGRSSFGCDLVVFARDSSGSVYDKTQAVFAAEARGWCELYKPKRIVVIDCDSEVHRWDEVQSGEDIPDEVKGGGGTAFSPVFDRIAQEGLEPDVLIYLTDLMGSYPSGKPSYPVVWGSVTPESSAWYQHYKPPFGEVVFVPQQNKEA
jgi:predicted metal-dependent peptidase